MRIAKFAGLPAHPLFVHIPVVMIPLVAIGAVAMACSARVRDRLGWVVLGGGGIDDKRTQLAIGSGQALQESVQKSSALDRHVAIAESIRPLALLLFLVALGVMLVDRRKRGSWPFRAGARQGALPAAARAGLVAVTIVVAITTCVRLYQIGDSGAKATWQSTHIVSSDREG